MYSHSPTVFRTYRFDTFEVDTRSGELRQDGVRIPLQDVPFRLLAALLEHPGVVCNRDELRNEIWPAEVHLDFEGALATAARKVRQALGDSSHAPRFIETLPGRGFRFIGEVNVVPEGTSLPQTAHAAPSTGRRFPVWTTFALLAGLAVTVLVVWNVRGRVAGAAKLASIRSIAVLPLENLSGNSEQDYFADGMTDALTTELGRISGFDRVIAWQSMKRYKNTTQPIAVIARELDVDALVQGTVQREGTQVRIATKLFRTRQEKQLWAWSYDRDAREVLSLQREVAEAIAREVHGAVAVQAAGASAHPPSVVPEAYEFYLRGNLPLNLYDRAALFISVQMFQKAIALDPGFSQAFARLAEAHGMLLWHGHDPTEARRDAALKAATRAHELQPHSAEAHLALGFVYYACWLNHPRAIEEFETARRINPNHPEVQLLIGFVLRRQGKTQEALPFIERAAALNPNSAGYAYELGTTYDLLRRYADALRWCRRSLLLGPQDLFFARTAWFALLAGRNEEARAILAEARDKSNKHRLMPYYRYQLERWSGNHEAALKEMSAETLEEFMAQWYYVPKALLEAQALGALGRTGPARGKYDQARQVLEDKLRIQPKDDRLYGSLGIAYAGLGRKKEAIEAGKKGMGLGLTSKDAFRDRARHEDMAHIFVMVGEHGEALKELDYLLSIPSEISTHALMNDPTWAPLKSSKGFQDLVRKYGH